MSIDATLESSLLMWALAALIVGLAAHVMLGWMRQAQEEWEWDFGRVRQVIVGSVTFGTALSVATPLGLAGEALGFPIGYHPLAAGALWIGAVLVVTLLALVPVWREEGISAAAAGFLLGLVMTALQVGWMLIVGFRPGVRWDPVFVGAAAAISAAGTSTAMAVAFPYGEQARRYSYSWRIAAAGLIGLSFLAGYALVLFAADLPVQVGSVYRYALPSNAISLLGGGLLPIVLALMVMDLESRRKQRRRELRSRRRGQSPAYGPVHGSGVGAPFADSMLSADPSRPPAGPPNAMPPTGAASVPPGAAAAPLAPSTPVAMAAATPAANPVASPATQSAAAGAASADAPSPPEPTLPPQPQSP